MERYRPTLQRKVRSLRVRLTNSEFDHVHRAAAARMMTLSGYIIGLIDDDFARFNAENARKNAKKTRKKAQKRTILQTGAAYSRDAEAYAD